MQLGIVLWLPEVGIITWCLTSLGAILQSFEPILLESLETIAGCIEVLNTICEGILDTICEGIFDTIREGIETIDFDTICESSESILLSSDVAKM